MANKFSFKAIDVDKLQRRKMRPLDEFSDAVVETMPKAAAAAQNHNDLINLAGSLNYLITQQRLPLAHEPDFALSRTDIMYAYTVLAHRAKALSLDPHRLPIKNLLEAVKTMERRSGKLPILDYEDLLLVNPLETDPRTFFPGTLGGSERAFLWGHQIMEARMSSTIQNLQGYIRDKNVKRLDQVRKDCTFLVGMMKRFKTELSHKDFLVFRTYFSANPMGDFLGISGRWSARVPHIQLLVDGDTFEDIDPNFYEDRFANYRYFPPASYQNFLSNVNPAFCPKTIEKFGWPGGGKPPQSTFMTAAQLVEGMGNPDKHVKALNAIRDQLDELMKHHLGTVERHISELIGTSGTQPKIFLNPTLDRHKKAAIKHGQMAAPAPQRTAQASATPRNFFHARLG